MLQLKVRHKNSREQASPAVRRANRPAGRPARINGMTLIEILVVLVLIGIVLGIVGGNFIGRGEKAKGDAAKIEIGQISQALDLFKLETGRYPATQEGLQALIQAPPGASNWNGPYWKRSTVPKDPWGNEYKYISPGQGGGPYDILSLGADGKEGGEGPNKDITSSQ
ncbi:MAG: type II secretion system major pseudopilin GspG [Vicinamibacterales bacterium]